MITEDYVSFEIAKLLKEKRFNGECLGVYFPDGRFYTFDTAFDYNLHDGNLSHAINAPTLQMAMKWLREVHSIDISVVPHCHKEGKTFDYEFVYWNSEEYHTPYNEKYPIYHELFGKTWKKYEEACEAAIQYCLKNLI